MSTSPSAPSEPRKLVREVGVSGAILLGLGSIVGTGVFVSLGIAAGQAGPAVVLAIAAAAVVATCNGLSSAQLAASHPVSGGTYEYGYRYLNPALGFTAGWMFLCAKSASAATAALGFAGYLQAAIPALAPLPRIGIALAALGLITGVVLGGLRRSNRMNGVIVGVTLASLGAFVLLGVPEAVRQGVETWRPFFGSPAVEQEADTARQTAARFLEACALMFVAYTGYGRIATLGEEIHDPRKNIPRAMIATLAVSMVLYVSVGAVAVGAAGAERFAKYTTQEAAPLARIAEEFSVPGVAVLLSVGAMTAMLGVLLNLVLGLSRVVLAMSRRGDFPRVFRRVNASGTTPAPAVLLVCGLTGLLIGTGSVRSTWSFSAFTVLIYYATTNLAALRLPPEERLYPRSVAWVGLLSCLFLAGWVETRIWLSGGALIALGLVWHAAARRLSGSGAGGHAG